MFENLSSRLQGVFSKLKSRGHLSEKDVQDALREVRLALLEADVNFKVVKELVSKIKERSVGTKVLESLTPGQQVIKIVHEELSTLMGGTQSKLIFASKPPTVIMLVGLHGSGKTTTAVKLASYLKTLEKKPFLVAADIYRPAAVEQLCILGKELGVSVFSPGADKDAVHIAKQGLAESISKDCDTVILDTAGRLHIDEKMMEELERMKEKVQPHQILLVVDAMTGQDAVNLALAFQQRIDFDGTILTKLDGDARGGAALSIKAVTGKPIKFVTIGEKLDSLEPFYPDRMASRILGMGDVLSLIEKAEAAIDTQKAEVLQEKLRKQQFTLEDFLDQMQQMKKMGPISQILKMLPNMPGLPGLKHLEVDDHKFTHLQAIIQSMTPAERRNPNTINGSRRLRIAKGSGVTTNEVNQLLKQFSQVKKFIKLFNTAGSKIKGKRPFPLFP